MSGRARVSRRLILATIPLIAGTGSWACNGTSAPEQREQLADDLVEQTRGALDAETSRCVADALHEEFGDDAFQRLLDAPSGASGDVRSEVIEIFSDCDALRPIIDGPTIDGPD